jgi:pimeloyl-ACP methyl ester carboxylesterase
VETLRHLVEVAGQTGTAVEQAVSELQTLSEDVDAIAAGDVAGEPVGGASRQFWASWITASRAATDHVRAAQTPVAVIGGENDWNVPPEHVEAWQPFLGVDDSLRILPEITHALTRLEADDPAAIAPADVGTKVDPSVLGAITDECTRILGEAAD